MQVVQLASSDVEPLPYISFEDFSEDATLVVVMSVPTQDYGFTYGGGQANQDVRNDPLGQTYVGGSCITGFMSHYDYVVSSGVDSWDSLKDNQWYVRINSDIYTSLDSSKNHSRNLSKGEIAGIAIAVLLVGCGLCACVGYFVFNKLTRPDEQTLALSKGPSSSSDTKYFIVQ